MKTMKTYGWLGLMMLIMGLPGGCMARQAREKTFVTSFYPMYIFTLNITRDVPGVKVVNMADTNVGCLHDYQLQTRDMVAIEGADALIINGGGMEQFMDKVSSLRTDLPVIDASEGIEMLCGEEEAHHEHGHEHDHEHIVNAHVWLDPELAAEQVKNIARGLAAADEEHADAYEANAQTYCETLRALDEEIAKRLEPAAGSEIITFHEAFPYFARAYGLEIAGVIQHEPGEDPGTREIAETCDLVRELGITALFVEPQYPVKSAQTIAAETGAKIYTLDPIVSGDGSMESYEAMMRRNADVLEEALVR